MTNTKLKRPKKRARNKSPDTLADLRGLKMVICGQCDHHSHKPRMVNPETFALVAKYGPDALTQEIMGRITCRECGNLVDMRLSAISARAGAPNRGSSGNANG